MRHRPLGFLLLCVLSTLPRPALAAWSTSPLSSLVVCGESHDQYLGASVSDGAGGLIVVWDETRNVVLNDGNDDVYAQHVLASGTLDPAWPAAGLPVCTAPQRQQNARITSDGAGGAYIVWEDTRAGGTFDIYAHHVLSSGVVDPAWPVNGVAVCALPQYQYVPAIISDGSGGAIIAWQDNRDFDIDIYANHLLATGVLDPAWPADGRAVCIVSATENHPVLVSDLAGGAIIAWLDDRDIYEESDGETRVFAQHLLASGLLDPAWPADDLLLGTAPAEVSYAPVITGDGAGGALVGWIGGTLRAQHALVNGTIAPQWPDSGLALSGPDAQETPAVVPDGAGGAIFAWEDIRSGVHIDVYTQRVRPDGTTAPGWPAGGLGLCTAPGARNRVAMTSDQQGGAIVTWDDFRTGDIGDVYAQRVTTFGAVAPHWATDGVAIANGASYEAASQVVSDTQQGALVTFVDNKAGNFDVCAQRVTRGGSLGAPLALVAPAPPATTFTLSRPAPNPADRATTLRFVLAHPGRARLDVFDTAGRRVRSLGEQEFTAGEHLLTWDLQDADGRRVRAGRYYFRLESNGAFARTSTIVRR